MGKGRSNHQRVTRPEPSRLAESRWRRWSRLGVAGLMLSGIPSNHGFPPHAPAGIGVRHAGRGNGIEAVQELDRFVQRTRFPIVAFESPMGTRETNARSMDAYRRAIQEFNSWVSQSPRTPKEIEDQSRVFAQRLYRTIKDEWESPGTDEFRIEWGSYLIRKGLVPRPLEEYSPAQVKQMEQLYNRSNQLSLDALQSTSVKKAFELLDQSEALNDQYMALRDAGIKEGYDRLKRAEPHHSPFLLVGQHHQHVLSARVPMKDLTLDEVDFEARVNREGGPPGFAIKRRYLYKWVEQYRKLSETPVQRTLAEDAMHKLESLRPEELVRLTSLEGKDRLDLMNKIVISLNQLAGRVFK